LNYNCSVESAENRLLRFAENHSGDTQEALEAREDARLLGLIADADPQALEQLYRRRGSLIYSLLLRMLVNEMEAQEITQDTFVQIWRRAHRYDPRRSSPMAWTVMIARGLAMDRLRARSRHSVNHAAYEREVASLEVEEITGVHKTERDELAASCRAAMNELPEAQGRALQLAFIRGWTHEEIAAAIGEPLGTVKARIRRGLLALRKALKDFHG
jgi:RNA polymerase sigma-70 factor (ECF subfamily)